MNDAAAIPPDPPASNDRRRRVGIALAAGALVLVGVAMHLPSLGWGFVWDDYHHQFVLADTVPGMRATAWNLYDFDQRATLGRLLFDLGLAPWWADDDLLLRFFRPVTSATLVLDHALYGQWPVGYHLTNLAWFAAFLVLAWRLLRTLPISSRAALLALGILAVDDVHGSAVNWIANRNSTVAGVFTLATVLALERAARGRGVGWWIVTVAMQLLAFGAKESGIMAGPLALAYLWLAAPQAEREPPLARLVRLMRDPRLWLIAIIPFALLAGYVAAGYGVRSLMYLTPWRSPVEWLTRIAIFFPTSLVCLFFMVPTAFIMVLPWTVYPFLAAAAVLLPALTVAVAKVVGPRRVLGFAIVWIGFSLLVEGGSEINERLLMTAAFGSALVLGLFFDALLAKGARAWSWRHAPLLLLAAALASANTLGSLGVERRRNDAITTMARADEALNTSIPIPQDGKARSVFVLNGRASLQVLGILAMRSVLLDDFSARFYPIQFGRRGLHITRESKDSLVIRTDGSPLATNMVERLMRTRQQPHPPGTVFTSGPMRVEVLETDGDGYRTVRVQTDRPLDDSAYLFVGVGPTGYTPVSLPTVGSSMELGRIEPVIPLAP